jgi:hypothetical protein
MSTYDDRDYHEEDERPTCGRCGRWTSRTSRTPDWCDECRGRVVTMPEEKDAEDVRAKRCA